MLLEWVRRHRTTTRKEMIDRENYFTVVGTGVGAVQNAMAAAMQSNPENEECTTRHRNPTNLTGARGNGKSRGLTRIAKQRIEQG